MARRLLLEKRMRIERHHAKLLGALLAVVGATPVCVSLVACGGASTTSDADGGHLADQRNCGQPSPATRRFTTTFCSDIPDAAPDANVGVDADSDAGADGSTDADGFVDTDAGFFCATTCDDACRHVLPGLYDVPGSTCSAGPGDGGVEITCMYEQPGHCGRRFAELAPHAAAEGDALGAFLAHSAWLEAASITAFRRLARDLASHGAPRELVAAAKRAARDEIRHARAMTRLARRHGANVPRVEHAAIEARSLEALAIENAMEGCVGETYGAALAAWQSRHASDLEIRTAMAAIADDELAHAALGLAIHEWALGVLDRQARARVEAARREAVAALAREVLVTPPAALVREAGLPAPADALRLAMLAA
jgi:hypothetical protein